MLPSRERTLHNFEDIPLRSERDRLYERISLELRNPYNSSRQHDQSQQRLGRQETVLEMDEIPPPGYSPSEPPPPYLRKSLYQPDSYVHRLAVFLVNFDFVSNCILLFLIAALYFSESASSSPASYLIPFIYFTVSLFGRGFAFKRKNPKAMLLVAGAWFARWAGDLAVLIYVVANDFHSYFHMSVFTTLITLPMLGIRGFYPDLFPCYNMTESDGSDCSDWWTNSAGTINGVYVFCLVLFPQLVAGAVILYDAFYIIQVDEEDFHDNVYDARRRQMGTVRNV